MTYNQMITMASKNIQYLIRKKQDSKAYKIFAIAQIHKTSGYSKDMIEDNINASPAV